MSYQEFRPGRFLSLPVVVKNILIINIILFAAKHVIPLNQYFDLYYYKSEYFRPYQFITYMFMHGNFSHIFFNMFGVYMFGSILENLWGSKRFLNFYLLTGLGAAVAQYLMFYYEINKLENQYGVDVLYAPQNAEDLKFIYNHMACLGASGALFGLLGAFAFTFPNTYLNIYFFIPMKAKYFVILYGAAELVFGVMNTGDDNVAHFAHLGGLIVGLIIVFIWRKNKNFFY